MFNVLVLRAMPLKGKSPEKERECFRKPCEGRDMAEWLERRRAFVKGTQTVPGRTMVDGHGLPC